MLPPNKISRHITRNISFLFSGCSLGENDGCTLLTDGSGSPYSSHDDFDPSAVAYHDRLGVSIDANIKKVRKEGKKASNIYHPDKNSSVSEREYIRISDAKKTLTSREERRDYQLFCLNLGTKIGTHRFETWVERGKPKSAKEIIREELLGQNRELFELSELDKHTPLPDDAISLNGRTLHDTDEEGDLNLDSDNSDTDGSNETTPDKSSDNTQLESDSLEVTGHTVEPDDGFTDTTGFDSDGEFGSGVLDVNDQLDMSLSSFTALVSDYTSDESDLLVDANEGGFDEILISGFSDVGDFYFNFTNGDINYLGDETEQVTWHDLAEDRKFCFKHNNERLEIELEEAGQSADHEDYSQFDADDSLTTSENTTSPVDETSTSGGGLFSIIIENIDTTLLKYTAIYVSLSLLWFGVSISPFLNETMAVGWMGLLLLFRSVSLYLSSLLTIYMMIPFGLVGIAVPDTGMTLTISIIGMVIASLTADSPIRRELLGR